uniref:(northern house mosquito) hypothetical protein n=1 Tax=Culex pipiens TaxID=7175 RepID=A0A8D8KQ96_CULPI
MAPRGRSRPRRPRPTKTTQTWRTCSTNTISLIIPLATAAPNRTIIPSSSITISTIVTIRGRIARRRRQEGDCARSAWFEGRVRERESTIPQHTREERREKSKQFSIKATPLSFMIARLTVAPYTEVNQRDELMR